MPRTAQTRALPALGLLLATASVAPAALSSQTPPEGRPAELRVTDPRLEDALERLLAGSKSAREVVRALSASGLPVAIGTPARLAALPESQGGPATVERRALLAEAQGDSGEPPLAWVVFRVAAPSAGASSTSRGTVERVWLAVEVDTIAEWIRRVGLPDPEGRIAADLLATLAHEFVAHVGSIARTRDLADFCDDPPPASERLPGDRGADACSIRVENRVRKELNEGLDLTGEHRLPRRSSYALDQMQFARAFATLEGRGGN